MKPLKRPILGRYEHTEDGRVIVDITAAKIEDLFNDLDKVTPYAKKDLDKDFCDYLVDSAGEIGKHAFLIRINLGIMPPDNRRAMATEGIHNFFSYMKELQLRQARSMFRTSTMLLTLGFFVLLLSIWVHSWVANQTSVFLSTCAEGLTIAAWVMLWESLATYLIQWKPHRKDVKQFERLAQTEIIFRAYNPDQK